MTDRAAPTDGVAHPMAPPDARARVAAVIGLVLRQALRDSGRRRFALLRPETPEGELLAAMLSDALPRTRLDGVQPDSPADDDALLLDPGNKTALVFAPARFRAPLLPLGDLYAGQVRALQGGWSAPDEVVALARRAGGVDTLDGYLVARLDERRAPAVAAERLPAAARQPVETAYTEAAWWRRRAGLVPKIGPRTLGVDFF